MENTWPTAFKIFIISISLIGIDLLGANLTSYYHVNIKFAIWTAFVTLIGLNISSIGFYAGIIYKSDIHNNIIKNRIGIIGNLLIILVVLGIMLAVAIVKTRQ